MAGLRYLGQNPEKIAASVEQIVRKELGAPTPIPYQILPGTSGGATPGSLLGEWAQAQLHMTRQAASLCYVNFRLGMPRPFEIQVSIIRQGLGALVGKCVFVAPLSRPVRGPIGLGQASRMSAYKFTGEPATSERLNNNRDLLAKAYKLSIPTSTIGRTKITIPRRLEVRPTRTGSVLVVDRLPQTFLFINNMGISDLLAFVPMLEHYL
jgi:hypothetical protein